MSDLNNILSSFESKFSSVRNKDELQNLKSEFFGKNGSISLQFKKMGSLNSEERKISAILHIDTGMNRLGLSLEEINFLKKNKGILNITKWDFIMSHLTSSNDYKNTSNN